MAEVVARVLYSLDPALREVGFSLDEVLVEHGLSPRQVRARPGGRIAWNAFAEILADAGERIGGNLALEEVGANSLFWSWRTLISLTMRYSTPFMAFKFGVRWFCPVLFRGIRADVEEIPGGLVETVDIPPDLRDSSEFFSLCRGVMLALPAVMGWETTRCDLSHSDHRGVYRMTFVKAKARARPRRAAKTRPDLDGDLEELSVLTRELDLLVPCEPAENAENPITSRIRAILQQDEQGMAMTAAEAASRLAMSERSLARSLASEGKSFRAVRDEMRRDVALERLRDGVAISEVAYLLGFSDTAAFYRAFRRWTGDAPGRYKSVLESAIPGVKSQDFGLASQFESVAPRIP